MTTQEIAKHKKMILRIIKLEEEAGKLGCHIFVTALNDCKNKMGWRLAEAQHGDVREKRL